MEREENLVNFKTEHQKLLKSEKQSEYGTNIENKQNFTPNPEKKSFILSRIFFSFVIPILDLGYKRPLEQEDLWNLNSEDTPQELEKRFNFVWDNEKKKQNPNFLLAVFKFLGFPYARIGLIRIGCDTSSLLGFIFIFI